MSIDTLFYIKHTSNNVTSALRVFQENCICKYTKGDKVTLYMSQDNYEADDWAALVDALAFILDVEDGNGGQKYIKLAAVVEDTEFLVGKVQTNYEPTSGEWEQHVLLSNLRKPDRRKQFGLETKALWEME